MIRIWLDDIRDPPSDGWIVCRSVADATATVVLLGPRRSGRWGRRGRRRARFDTACSQDDRPEEATFDVQRLADVGRGLIASSPKILHSSVSELRHLNH